jgi:hypothetical protein
LLVSSYYGFERCFFDGDFFYFDKELLFGLIFQVLLSNLQLVFILLNLTRTAFAPKKNPRQDSCETDHSDDKEASIRRKYGGEIGLEALDLSALEALVVSDQLFFVSFCFNVFLLVLLASIVYF